MADNNNITLKVDMDISDAQSAVDKFTKTAGRAFSSSNTKIQKMGATLTQAAAKVNKLTSDLQKMEIKNIPTQQYKDLQKQLESVKKQYDKATEALSKLASKKVPSDEYIKLQNTIKTLQQQIKETESSTKKLEQTEAFKNATANVNKYEKQLASVNNQLEILDTKSKTSGLSTQENVDYQKLKEQANALAISLGDAQAQQQRLIDTGRQYKDQRTFEDNTMKLGAYNALLAKAEIEMKQLESSGAAYRNSDEFIAKQQQAEQLKGKIDSLNATMRVLENTGNAYTSQSALDPDKARATEEALKGTVNQYAILNNETNEAIANESTHATKVRDMYTNVSSASRKTGEFTSSTKKLVAVWNTLKSVIGKVNSSVKNKLSSSFSSFSSKHNMSFKKMITTVLKYAFGIRSIFLLYRKLRTVISTGLTEMGKQFTEVQNQINSFKNSWATFKSSLISAFQPIYSYVLPALTTLINYLSTAMNALANFLATITGQGYYYKAIKQNKDYGDSVSGTGDSAKEASEELAEYDDLIVITSNDASSGGSGGGSSSGDEWKWEKVTTESANLTEKLQKVWQVFKDAWDKYGDGVVTAAKSAFESIKSLLGTIAETVYNVFTNGTGAKWVESVLLLFTDMLTTIDKIASAWEKAWRKDGNGYKLVKSIFDMFTSINTLASKIAKSFNNAWDKNGTGVTIISNILKTFTSINNTVKNLIDNLGKAWEKNNVGDRILSTILGTITSISTFISNIASATETWSKKIDFYPLLESISDVLESIKGFIDKILEVAESLYTNYILPIVEKIVESTLPDIIEDISDFVEDITDALDEIDWDSLFSTLEDITELALDTYTEYIEKSLKDIEPTIKNIGTYLGTCADALKLIKGTIDEIKTTTAYKTLKNIYDKFQQLTGFNTFKFNFANMFPGIAKVVSSIDTLVNTIKKIKTFIEENDWESIGKNIVQGLKEGIVQKGLVAWIKTKITNFVNKVKEFFGIHSPSTVFKAIGENLIDGLKEGIKNAIKNIATWLKNNVIKKITGAWDKVKTLTVKLAGSMLPSFTSLKTAYDAVKDKVSTLTANAKEKTAKVVTNMKNMWDGIKDKTAEVTTKAKDLIEGGVSKLKETLTNIGKTFTATVETVWSTVKDKGKEVVTNIQDKLDTIAKGAKAKIETVLEEGKEAGKTVTSFITDKLNFFSGKHSTKVTTEMDDTSNAPSGSKGVFSYIDSELTKYGKGTSATVTIGATQGKVNGKSWTSISDWLSLVSGKTGLTAEATVNLVKGISTKTKKAWDSIKQYVEDISGKGNDKVTATVDLATGTSWGKKKTVAGWATSADSTDTNGNPLITTWVNLASKWTSVAGWCVGHPDYKASQLSAATSYLDVWVNLKKGTNTVGFNVGASGGKITGGTFSSWFAGGGSVSKTHIANWANIPKYASGTNKVHGTMFLAGEAGPEIVGHVNGKTEILNRSQLASTMYSAIIAGMSSVMSKLKEFTVSTDYSPLLNGLTQIPIPVIVTGQILPATEAFFANYDLQTKVDSLESKLDNIIDIMLTNSTTESSNHEPIVIQLNGREFIKLIWNEAEKRYKQSGRYSLA